MTYKECFERLRTEIQFALSDYETARDKELYEQAENGMCLYHDIVDIINDTEDWNFDGREV